MTASLAARLRGREPLLGTLLRMPNEALIEMTALVGMDFVVIDTEHGPGDQLPLTHHLMAAAAAGIPALVRVGTNAEILRVLDLGAAGIIAPHISSVEQAEAVVRAAHYPPRGDRGFATYTRSGRHGLIGTDEHLANARANTAIVLMIEDGPGVEAAEQIASVDGVDALFVGPADLSVALGFPGQPGSATVKDAITAVHDAARSAGAAVVTITGDPAVAREHFSAGSNMVIYNVLAALGGLFTGLAGGRGETVTVTSAPASAPLILLPGTLGTPAVWDAVVDGLAPTISARAGRIDLDDTISGMAESVLAQAPERFSLAGHSLGAVVALEIARRAPHRLERLVLLNSSGRGPSETQLQAWQQLSDRVEAGGFSAVVQEQAEVNLGPAVDVEGLRDHWLSGAHQVGPDGFRRQLAAQASRQDNRHWLSGLTVPTLIISGALDEVARPELQAELAAHIPGAALVTLPDSGHMSALDSASEVAAVISDFLG